VIFRTKNTSFYFFHGFNNFIFLELPKYQVAVFYFFNKVFETQKAAYEEAMKLIEEVY
jgi:hypothetical protein